jgi:hypothetical protein
MWYYLWDGLLGWVSSFGSSSAPATWYGANVFPKGAQAEQLCAVATYATAANTSYEVSLYRNPTNGPVSLSPAGLRARLFPIAALGTRAGARPKAGDPVYTQSGTFTYAGLHTVVLTSPVNLQASDSSFSVVFKLTNASYGHVLPVELAVSGYSGAASASAGQGYHSQDGTNWGDLTAVNGASTANFCIKAYTAPPPPGYQPDAEVRNPDPDTYVGDGVINADGTNQTKSQNTSQGVKAVYSVRVHNDGDASDDIVIKGPAASTGWTVHYFDASRGATTRPRRSPAAAGRFPG